MEVIPAILTADVTIARKQFQLLKGQVPVVQLDVIDGVFADQVTLTPEFVAEYAEQFLVECHLMVKDPVEWVDRCVESGVERVLGQIEMMENQMAFVDHAMSRGLEAGIALDQKTEISEVTSEVWKWIDRVLVFGGQAAGSVGQTFEPQTLEKIQELKMMRNTLGYSYLIEVDGGVNMDTVPGLIDVGVDAVVLHSALFENGDPLRNLQRFQSMVG